MPRRHAPLQITSGPASCRTSSGSCLAKPDPRTLRQTEGKGAPGAVLARFFHHLFTPSLTGCYATTSGLGDWSSLSRYHTKQLSKCKCNLYPLKTVRASPILFRSVDRFSSACRKRTVLRNGTGMARER